MILWKIKLQIRTIWYVPLFQQLSPRFHFSITIDHTPNGPHTKLFIKSVQVHDEETYTCSVTYLEPSESCESNGSYKIKLNVLGMYCSDRVMTMKNECENKAHYEMLLLICLFFFIFLNNAKNYI